MRGLERGGWGGELVGVFPPSVHVRLPLEGWSEQGSETAECQSCRWRGTAVRGTTGTPSTVPLTLYRPLCAGGWRTA